MIKPIYFPGSCESKHTRAFSKFLSLSAESLSLTQFPSASSTQEYLLTQPQSDGHWAVSGLAVEMLQLVCLCLVPEAALRMDVLLLGSHEGKTVHVDRA